MKNYPSRFTPVIAAGNKSEVSLADDFNVLATADRRAKFIETLREIDALNSLTLSRDGNVILDNTSVQS